MHQLLLTGILKFTISVLERNFRNALKVYLSRILTTNSCIEQLKKQIQKKKCS